MRLQLGVLALVTVLVACKARNPEASGLRSETGEGADSSVGKSPDAAQWQPPTAKESTLTTDAIQALAESFEQKVDRGMQIARIDGPSRETEGLALTGEARTSYSIQIEIAKLHQRLNETKMTLETLKQLGDTSSETYELQKMVDDLTGQLALQQGLLATTQNQEQAAAQEAERQRLEKERREREERERAEAERLRLAEAERLRQLRERRDAEIRRIKLSVIQIYLSSLGSDGAACTLKFWTSNQTLSLSDGSWPFSESYLTTLTERQMWSNESSQYVSAGNNLELSGGSAVWVLIKYPDSCGAKFRGGSNMEFMGEAKSGDSTFGMYGVLNSLNRFNGLPVAITNTLYFFRQAKRPEGSSSDSDPNPDRKSAIYPTNNDCQGIARDNQYFCQGWDCKAITQKRKGYCDTDDCKAILDGKSWMCDTRDCRAIVNNNPSLCDSMNCTAVLSKKHGDCSP